MAYTFILMPAYPEMLRVLCLEIEMAPCAEVAYARCRRHLPARAQMLFTPLLEGLCRRDAAEIRRQTRRLCHVFRQLPIVRMVVVLLVLLERLWAKRMEICALLGEMAACSVPRRLLGRISNTWLSAELAMLHGRLTPFECVSVLLCQLPPGKRGQQLRRQLTMLLRAARLNSLARMNAIESLRERCDHRYGDSVLIHAAVYVLMNEKFDIST